MQPGCTRLKTQTATFLTAMRAYLEKRNAQWLERWQNPATGEFPDGIKKDLINEHQADNHLVKWAVETGQLDAAIKGDSVQARNRGRFTAIIYHRSKLPNGGPEPRTGPLLR